MKSFSFICPLFIFCLISSSHSSEAPATGLGIALCSTNPLMGSECKTEDLPPSSFPEECTSFDYLGLDLSNGTCVDMGEKVFPKGYLDSLLALKKSVALFLVRTHWNQDIKCIKQNGAEKEMEMVKSFLDQHKGITGLMLFKLELFPDDKEDPEYCQNLITYIGILRKTFPQLKIGIYLNNGMILNTLGTPQLENLDIADLAKDVDFIRILSATDQSVDTCSSPDYVHGDAIMNSFNKQVLDYISGLKIPKEKILWDHWGMPTSANTKECGLTYTKMCLNPNSTYCAEPQQKLYDKGKNFKEIAGGFAFNYIDRDDVNCACQCDRPFPAFHALLDGFNGNPAPKECCLMDRP